MGSSNTKIEWTDRTWNPLRGCTRVSQGCTNCYAEKIAYRFSGPGQAFEGLAKKVGNEARWTGKVMLVEKELETPFSWKNPSKVFVNSVSDLFHESVPFDFIDEVFYTMALAENHTFQILTKRPERMLEYFQSVAERFRLQAGKIWFSNGIYIPRYYGTTFYEKNWPLKNVWVGVSVEDQKTADERIPLLLQVPAEIHFLSCEPLIGPVSLKSTPMGTNPFVVRNWLEYNQRVRDGKFNPKTYNRVDWVIAGGESGRWARQMNPDWVRSLRFECQKAGVKFFFKQWGEWLPFDQDQKSLAYGKPTDQLVGDTIQGWTRVGKKAAGRELDGRTWDEMPERAVEAWA